MNTLKRIVVTWLSTGRGGAEKSSLELCETIQQRYQLEVVLVVWNFDRTIQHPYNSEDSETQIHNCFSVDEYRFRLAGALSVDSASTVLFSNHRTYHIDSELAFRHRVKWAVIFRLTPMADQCLRTLQSSAASELVFRCGDELDWEVLGCANALVGVSDFCAQGITRFLPKHPFITRIYNAPKTVGESTRPLQPARRFLMVSRLISSKMVAFAIDSFERLYRKYGNVSLEIAGDGEELQTLREHANGLDLGERVKFLGFRENIAQVYQDNDCLLHFTDMEAFGRVVIEAGKFGCPAVIPQGGGIGELVINGHSGFTFRASDRSDCFRALECMYQLSGEEYLQMSRVAKRRASALFSPDRLAEEYVGLANSMIVHRVISGPVTESNNGGRFV